MFSPLGTPPTIKFVQPAPRLQTIEGKNIYIVDVKYPATKPFFVELIHLLSERYPKTNWIIKEKTGTYFEDDPNLWQEIKENGHGMVIGIGH